MRIDKSNIRPFITYLYKLRRNEEPSAALLDSWSNLDNEEIKFHLTAMFQSWSYSYPQMSSTIDRFLASRNAAISESPAPALASVPQQSLESQPLFPSIEPAAAPAVPKAKDNSSISTGNTTFAEAYNKKQAQKIKLNTGILKSTKGLRLASLLALTCSLLVIGYLSVRYISYKALQRSYVITDNVTVRSKDGKSVGRMDIFPGQKSVNNLRVLDDKLYPIKVGNAEYASRKMLLDDAGFWAYLKADQDKVVYVNANYLTDDAKHFNLYKTVFVEINKVKNENSGLTSNYRKVIIESIKDDHLLNSLYITNTCGNDDRSYASVIKYKTNNNIHVVVARLSNKGYYVFSGNPQTQEYYAPKKLQYKMPYEESYVDLDPIDCIFKKNESGNFSVYDCSRNFTGYTSVSDAKGVIKYIKSSFDQ